MSQESLAAVAAVVAYLVARALAKPLAQKSRGAAFGLLWLAGAALAAAARAIGSRGVGATAGYWLGPDASGLLGLAGDAAAALAMYAVASAAFSGSSAEARGRGRSPVSRAIALLAVVPIALGLAWAVTNRPINAPEFLAAAAVSAAALWLATDVDRAALAASALALAAAGVSGAPGQALWALAIAAAASALRFALAKMKRPALPGVKPAVSAGLAWALSTAGLGWAGSGLAAGAIDSVVDSAARARGESGGARGPKGPSLAQLGLEASSLFCFVSGLRADLWAAVQGWPWTLAAAAALALAAWARAAVLGESRPAEPVAASALAVLAIGTASLAALPRADAVAAGLALAYLALAPVSADDKRPRGAAAFRALVGIDPGHGGACAVGFAAAIGPEAEPVKAVCVSTAEKDKPKAEEALVRAVVAGAADGVRVLPSVASAPSVAAGLAAAAAERGAESIALGPIADLKSAEREGTPLSALLAGYGGTVIALDRADPFSGGTRLVIAAMAGQERSARFREALEALASAWDGSPRSLCALAVGGKAQPLADAAAGLIHPRNVAATESWRSAASELRRFGGRPEGYRFAVFAARPGSSSWNPGHERLPAALAASFPGSSTTLWFLPEQAPRRVQGESAEGEPANAAPASPAAGEDRASESDIDLGPDLPPLLLSAYSAGRVVTGMREDALVDAVRRLVASILPEDKAAAGRLASEFSSIARREPIELAQGILLLHGYAKGVTMPELAIGSRMEGWPLLALQSPVRILVVLVSPADGGSEAHLAALTQIALAFRNLGLADRLLGYR